MSPCFCYFSPPSRPISKFISDQPLLSVLENGCHTVKEIRAIHAQLIKTGLGRDAVAASRLLSFCVIGPEQDLAYALSLFRRIDRPNLFTWNTIIRGFCGSCSPHVSVSLFVEMLERSEVNPGRLTYPSVFKAYAQLGRAKDGGQLHGRIMKSGMVSDPFIRNSVIHMYASGGLVGDARKLFDESRERDVVAWNTLIMGLAKSGEIEESWRLFCKLPFKNEISWNTIMSSFVRNGKWEGAIDLFLEMLDRKMKPSEFALVSVLNACAKLGALQQGKWIHDYVKKTDMQLNVILLTAIIEMYSKCGEVEMARCVFEAAPTIGLSCWNAMIFGLAINGLEDEAFELFSELEASSLEPDTVSFIAVLSACAHSGRVERARHYFKAMKEAYGIAPTIQHYGCMVDVLGRVGLVEETLELISMMPVSPDAAVWGSLLSACVRYRKVGIAEVAAENLVSLDADDECGHVLMSKAYAATGQFKNALQERVKMKVKQVHKRRGCSQIEANGQVFEFVAGDGRGEKIL